MTEKGVICRGGPKVTIWRRKSRGVKEKGNGKCGGGGVYFTCRLYFDTVLEFDPASKPNLPSISPANTLGASIRDLVAAGEETNTSRRWSLRDESRGCERNTLDVSLGYFTDAHTHALLLQVLQHS